MKTTMTKKILFTLAVLCTSLWSCNTLDLNDVGYGDNERLKASSVKEILYGTADGCWKADYQGHEFYFQFHENGFPGNGSRRRNIFLYQREGSGTEY